MRTIVPLVALATVLAVLAFSARADDEATAPPRVRVGHAAPDLRLNDDSGRAVRLSEFGQECWTVLAFYPKALTPG